MTDAQTGEEQVVTAETQVDPATESQPEVVDQQPEETQSPESETGKNEVDVPKDNAAWAAQRVALKQTKEENKRLQEYVSSIDPEYLNRLREANTTPTYQPAPVQTLNDDADYTQVTQSVNLTQQQIARQNQQIANLQNQLELSQDRQAEEAFPELKTDKVFQQLVSEKKLASRMLGRQVTTMELAREVRGILGRRDEQVAVQAQAQAKQVMLEKQQALTEPRGTTTGGNSSVSDESLRQRVRMGDTEAQTAVAKGLIADLEF